MSSSESSELLRAGTSRRDVIISWLLIVAGLFLNVTLHFGDSGRVLLLTVFDVVLLLLLAHQVFRYGLQWSAWMVWPLITIFVLIAAAGVAFYLGDNIRIAGLLRNDQISWVFRWCDNLRLALSFGFAGTSLRQDDCFARRLKPSFMVASGCVSPFAGQRVSCRQ